MSSDTRHKIILQTSSKFTSYPLRVAAPTDENLGNMKHRSMSLSLSQTHEQILDTYSLIRRPRIEEDPPPPFEHKCFGFVADKGGFNKAW